MLIWFLLSLLFTYMYILHFCLRFMALEQIIFCFPSLLYILLIRFIFWVHFIMHSVLWVYSTTVCTYMFYMRFLLIFPIFCKCLSYKILYWHLLFHVTFLWQFTHMHVSCHLSLVNGYMVIICHIFAAICVHAVWRVFCHLFLLFIYSFTPSGLYICFGYGLVQDDCWAEMSALPVSVSLFTATRMLFG